MSRYPFSVTRIGDTAIMAMELSGNVIRVRHMPCTLLEKIGAMCRSLLGDTERALRLNPDIPDFPGYRQFCRDGVPNVCCATFGAHRLNGKIERVIAIYDDGDDTAPVLILVEEQIDEFIKQTVV